MWGVGVRGRPLDGCGTCDDNDFGNGLFLFHIMSRQSRVFLNC